MKWRIPAPAVLTPVVKVLVSASLLYWLLAQADLGRLIDVVKRASVPWLVSALALYLLMILVSAWRWGLLLRAQRVVVPQRTLVGSFLVATFFNNFLPSNIGGDVVRIRDTSREAGSVTHATTVVIVDRALGLLALLFVAAAGASGAGLLTNQPPTPVWPPMLWLAFGIASAAFVLVLAAPNIIARVASPLRVVNRQWVDRVLERLTTIVADYRDVPGQILYCFFNAIVVQAVIVAYYVVLAFGLGIPISPVHLAVVVPVSLVLQLLPVSVNGMGVREAAFSYYFVGLHLPVESAIALSLVGAGLILLFSLSGGLVYALR
jgi:uncharacterized protein (TIRG00374 family)